MVSVASEFWQPGGNETAKLGMKTDFDSDGALEASVSIGEGTAPQETSDAPKRGRGRPRGYPKSGGRQKGTKNYSQLEIRAELLDRSNAIQVLADIVAGRKLYCASGTLGAKPGWVYPSMRDRIKALGIVLAKSVPDLTATELTGAQGSALIPPQESTDTRATALAILSIAREAQMRSASEQQTEPVIERQRLPHRCR